METESAEFRNLGESESERERILLEVGRRVYDKLRYFMFVPEGMTNQIYRYGVMGKKSIDGSGRTRLHGSRNYWRDERTVTPNGALIIHRNDPDPRPHNCDAFIHPPYGSKQQYRGENDHEYIVLLPLSKLASSAHKCGFRSILYQGIYQKKHVWRAGWARYRWFSSHEGFDPVDAENQRPWLIEYEDEIETGIGVNEDDLGVNVLFTQGQKCLVVSIGILDRSLPEKPSSEPKTDESILRTMQDDARRRVIGEFEFYTIPNEPSLWAAFGPAPHIQPEVFSTACFQTIFGWLKPCVLWHQACVENPWRQKPSSNSPKQSLRSDRSWPNRLINKLSGYLQKHQDQDLQADDGFPARLLKLEWIEDKNSAPPVVRLEETTDPDVVYRYVALSHVWVFTTPYKTTCENYHDHKRQIHWSQLSQVLRETIVLILKLPLKIEYLWVDSLCIIQDDLVDKEKELPRMSLIYGRAEVVFAAHGPELGFEKMALEPIRDPNRPDDPPVYCRQKINHKNLFLAPKDPSSWLGRAWCMQERIFAPRILHFGGSAEEIFFECNTSIQCECGGIEPDALTLKGKIAKAFAEAKQDKSRNLRDELWKIYITVCEDYTPRGITFPSDKLSAVSSLMHTFEPQLGKYYAGLWEHNLIISMQWEAFDTGMCERHKEYVAPSFSWASISGPVIWYLDMKSIPSPETHVFASIVDISCELARSDACGPVSNGHITLRAYATDIKIEEKRIMTPPDGRVEMIKAGTKSCYVTLDSKQDYLSIEPGMTVKCLDIMRDRKGQHGNYVSGLIICLVDPQGSLYRRIGFSTMLEEHFKDSTMETVTII